MEDVDLVLPQIRKLKGKYFDEKSTRIIGSCGFFPEVSNL